MIDKLTSSDIANTVSMLRSTHKGPVLVVEGVTDCRLYSKFADSDNVRIVPAYSKDNVRKAVAEVWGHRNDARIIGIMDADIDRLCGKRYNPPLFLSDKRDLESMIMSTRALEDVLIEYSDPALLAEYEKRNGKVREVISRAAYPIGLLMFISSINGMGLNFKNIDHSAFIGRKTLTIDVRRMIDEVLSQSVNKGLSKKALADKISEEEELLNDPWIAVRGHDAVAILAIGFSCIFGDYNSKGMKEGQISGSLRLAFSTDYFADTELYSETQKWAKRNNFNLWIVE